MKPQRFETADEAGARDSTRKHERVVGPRILITRLSAIGDCIHTLPLAITLKQAFPTAHVAWAIGEGAHSLLRNHSAIDEWIVVSNSALRSIGGWREIARLLRESKFDLCLDPQSLTKSALLGWLSGAKRRIGFGRPRGRELAPWLHSENIVSKSRHVVDCYLDLVRPLGIRLSTSEAIRFKIPTDPKADQFAIEFLRENRMRRCVVLNPGAGWESKRWPIGCFAALAKQLRGELGLRSLITWAGAHERDMAKELAFAAGDSAVVAPETSLKELASLSRQAAIFVAGDTGPIHLAAAVGTSCVGLYGPTDAAVCGPYGPQHLVVQKRIENLGSKRKHQSKIADSMKEIQPADVFSACRRIWDRDCARTSRAA